ncbi:MAG TPA: c-type cytochrome [Candidatus Binatia bacterium]|nr:c-type cytochrome [Candidatus Binatia bacterium]
MTRRTKRNLLIVAALLLVVVAVTVWSSFFMERPQPGWITADQRDNFLYGSVDAEREAGIPYWIWLALPRMFPEYMPGNGGYVSVGLSWEEGKEMPAGFSKKIVGYIRVAGNCALCHAASYRPGPDEGPVVVPVVPGRAVDPQALLTFFQQCAQDARFNSTEIMTEINSATKLSWIDSLIYRYILIPRTKRHLLNQAHVVFDSTLQNHSRDSHSDAAFPEPRLRELATWVKNSKVPQYPLMWDQALVQAGKPLFDQHCGSCHAKDGKRQGTEVPIAEIGTDRELANKLKVNGYVAPTLDGIWMRGPYLHNGSVPSVGDLLKPPAQRATTFYRGNNLLNTQVLGFVSDLAQEKGLHFTLFDTRQPGNSNAGHLYGTELSDQEKKAILEYLKTL